LFEYSIFRRARKLIYLYELLINWDVQEKIQWNYQRDIIYACHALIRRQPWPRRDRAPDRLWCRFLPVLGNLHHAREQLIMIIFCLSPTALWSNTVLYWSEACQSRIFQRLAKSSLSEVLTLTPHLRWLHRTSGHLGGRVNRHVIRQFASVK
jgi:hypothetical protein